MGRDIVYSGTVGAALEANMYGTRSIALSARQHGKNYWAVLPGLLKLLICDADWKGAMCSLAIPSSLTIRMFMCQAAGTGSTGAGAGLMSLARVIHASRCSQTRSQSMS